ncbi:hypothetical protein O181_004332 [Austropuccinia psidii MF-1]|uniref:HAT C-terminal dimerisation domain-containing protein n=1 Tax=Austropuccinia psidii MF-1 TaxID=1389203 RepID=A0A9Q3BG13_9BASI|nr:hypothetical protein [Austropuccinia psidii MF-1]
MIPGGEWDEEKQALRYKYKCWHCSNKIGILGKNTSNLNKHRTRCVGRFSAWETKCPGFGFPWPKRRQIASLASQLYYESKQAIIDEVWSLPPETTISAAIDCWTTKDQSESYMATVIQWINPSTYMFHKKLLCFDTMGGSHSGVQLAWKFWESLSERGMLRRLYSITGDNAANNRTMMGCLERKFNGISLTWPKDERFHRCACHVLNLVAQDFLAQMGQLTDEDYFFFDDYLAVHHAPIEDSEDEESPTMSDLNDTIAKLQKNAGIRLPKRRVRPLNQRNLETQDNSGDLQLINGNEPNNPGTHHDTYEPEPLSSANKSIVRALRDLCSHIRGSPKQRQAFIQARDKTRDPKLLPINIPMTRWNYFLLQMKRAESLRLLIQLYTSTPEGSRYELSNEIWSAIEFMHPILSLIEQSCNVFQSKAPTKHLVLPYYHVILKRLSHYAQVSPPTWHNACVAASSKLKKYYNYEMQNNDTLTATLLNPKYRKEIFKLKAEKAKKDATLDRNSSPDYQSEPDKLDILHHLDQAPMESTLDFSHSEEDEVLIYLQNLHPVGKGEHILEYWKRQIITGNFPTLGKIAFRYLSIPASSASVERVFSHSGKLKSPVRASLGSRTIAHLTCLKEWLNDDKPF